MNSRGRVVILQFGDYADAFHRLQNGGPETYRDQRHSVEFVASLVSKYDVTTIAACDRPHDEQIEPGLRSIGIQTDQLWNRHWLWPELERLKPDYFICRSPIIHALRWAANHRIPTLPLFADIFQNNGIRNRWNNYQLARAIRRCIRPCVANHSLNASQSMQILGLKPDEIIPWEFQRLYPIGDAKTSPPTNRPFRLFFAGMLIESKGVGDCIDAVAILKELGHHVEITIVGKGDVVPWTQQAQQLGIAQQVHLPGIISSDQVLLKMREHDAVVVPSWHEYAEGLPNTIFEALASRSPLIISDHPAYAKRLRHGDTVLQFQAAHPKKLAEQVQRLIRDPETYTQLSLKSAATLNGLYVGMEWHKLIRQFLADPGNSQGWTRGHTLADMAK